MPASLRPEQILLDGKRHDAAVGIVPAAGGDIASFLGYNEAVRFSKDKESFGKGNVEGVAASEAANNGVTGGSLIPLLTLGIILGPMAESNFRRVLQMNQGDLFPMFNSPIVLALFAASAVSIFSPVIMDMIGKRGKRR